MGDGSLIGRQEERAQLLAGLRATAQGRSWVRVICGDPGVGKTSLVESVLTEQPGVTVLRLRGVQVEQDLPFAALQRLVRPHTDTLAALPGAYRHNLLVAVGLEHDRFPHRGLVGMGLLALLTELSTATPVVCWIDDAHWLDTESAATLSFVARRLHTERLAMVFAVRPDTGPPVFADLPSLVLTGLAPGPAGHLLRATVGHSVEPGVAHRVVTAVGGNPLAIVELSGGLSAAQLAGAAVLPAPLPVGSTLEAHYLRLAAGLPGSAQQWLLLAAAEDAGDAGTVARAARVLDLPEQAAAPAEEAGLIRVGHTLEFRHALVRSAVYNGATSAQRRRIHAAIAEVCTAPEDLPRRARHLADAAAGPDEAVAERLEEAADRAGSAGGLTARTALLLRAAALSITPESRAGRLLAALECAVQAGAYVQARAVLDMLRDLPVHGPARGRMLTASALTEVMLHVQGACARRPAMLLAAAEAFGTGPQHRDALMSALLEMHTAEELAEGATLAGVAGHVRRHAAAMDGPVGAMLLAHTASILDGVPAAAPALRAAIEAYLDPGASDDDVILCGRAAQWAATLLWDDAARTRVLDRAEAAIRRRGALFELVLLLNVRAFCHANEGRLRSALALTAEAYQVKSSIEVATHVAGYHMVVPDLAALLGEEELLRENHHGAVARMTYIGAGSLALAQQIAMMWLEIGRGDYAAADTHARRLDPLKPTGTGIRNLPEIIECAQRTGDLPRALSLLAALTEQAEAAGTDRALGLAARCRALTAPAEQAEAHYSEAVARSRAAGADLDLGRTLLLYGEWLRRQRRRRDARRNLRAATEVFDAMGARLFADRARREIKATGEKVRPRATDRTATLTPQETAVATLAGAGATNLDIATRLFISPSTVDYHLRKVFRKLGVSSRRQLADALPDSNLR